MGLLPSAMAHRPSLERQMPPAPQAPVARKPGEPIAKIPQTPPIASEPIATPHHLDKEVADQELTDKASTSPPAAASDRPLNTAKPSTEPKSKVAESVATPAAATPTESPGFDLVQVWNELIATLQPPGTQMLLRQQGRLVAFNGQEAKVGFTSQPLFKMAIERAPNIEAAFAKIYGHKIRVSLEVVAAKVDANGTGGNGIGTTQAIAQSAPPELRSPESQPPQPTVRESSAEFRVTPPSTPAIPTGERSPASAYPSPQPSTGGLEPALAAWQAEDEVSRAAKSFAQMFNGQIVSSDNLSVAIAAELPLAPEVDLLSNADTDTDTDTDTDEDDVPF